jgi:hypothetical protein
MNHDKVGGAYHRLLMAGIDCSVPARSTRKMSRSPQSKDQLAQRQPALGRRSKSYQSLEPVHFLEELSAIFEAAWVVGSWQLAVGG